MILTHSWWTSNDIFIVHGPKIILWQSLCTKKDVPSFFKFSFSFYFRYFILSWIEGTTNEEVDEFQKRRSRAYWERKKVLPLMSGKKNSRSSDATYFSRSTANMHRILFRFGDHFCNSLYYQNPSFLNEQKTMFWNETKFHD